MKVAVKIQIFDDNEHTEQKVSFVRCFPVGESGLTGKYLGLTIANCVYRLNIDKTDVRTALSRNI